MANLPLHGTKAVRHHCGQPLPPGGDDPASRHAHRVASKSHTHGKSLFAAGSGTFEAAVQIKGQPREIAQILQQGKEREKDGHGRKHDCCDPGRGVVYALYQQAVQYLRYVQGVQKAAEIGLQPGEKHHERL